MSDPNSDLQTPPPPQTPAPEGPEMTTGQTLTSIFFEPTDTFKALRTRSRFLIAGIITVLVFMAYYNVFVWRVGSEVVTRAQVESRQKSATPEQIEQAVRMQNHPAVKVITFASFPIVFAVIFAAGAGLYLLGVTLMGKTISFKQALSVWVYSTFPATVVMAAVNILLLFLKSPDDIDPLAINRGIAQTNLAILVDSKTQTLLATILGSFDVVAFYSMFLAATGLKVVARLPTGSAWTIVIAIWIVGVVIRVVLSLVTGQAY